MLCCPIFRNFYFPSSPTIESISSGVFYYEFTKDIQTNGLMTEEEAKEIISFVEMLLMLIYDFPARVT